MSITAKPPTATHGFDIPERLAVLELDTHHLREFANRLVKGTRHTYLIPLAVFANGSCPDPTRTRGDLKLESEGLKVSDHGLRNRVVQLGTDLLEHSDMTGHRKLAPTADCLKQSKSPAIRSQQKIAVRTFARLT